MKHTQHLFAVACVVAAAACSDDATTTPPQNTNDSGTTTDGGTDAPAQPDTGTTSCGLTIPATYESAAYETNAATELALRAAFKAYTDKLKKVETDNTAVTAQELEDLYGAGAPSLKSTSNTYFQGKLGEWHTAFAAAATKTWTPSEPPGAEGGKFGSYLFSARGVDLRQQIEKGLFGAVFYNHALTVMNGPLTEASIDKLVAIFGAHPSFPNDDKAAQNPDVYVASYAERRDKKDAANPGPYLKIKTALITAKAAIKEGDRCKTDRDAALATFRKEWEKALMATVIFYANDAATKLATDPATPTTQSNGLHSYNELVAFIHGFKGVPQSGRVITDAQLDELLTMGLAPSAGDFNGYKMVTDTAGSVGRLKQIADKVIPIYGFTAAEVDAFKVNN
jgi:hypothetical protein